MNMDPLATIEALLDRYRAELGRDFEPYRNHVHRVAALALHGREGDAVAVEKVAIAAALHDMGIWTDHTFDYLQPSIRLAEAHLAATGRSGWAPEIGAMILEHHKLTPWRGEASWLVEPFRRADWTDVSWGLLRFGTPPASVRQLYARWPDAGFHALLVRLELRHLGRHPLNPLPVLRW